MAEFDESLPKITEVVFDEAGNPATIVRNLTALEINGIAAAQAPQPPTDEQINAERDRRIEAGATFGITGLGSPVAIQGDEASRNNLQALGLAAFMRVQSGDTSTVTEFRDRENVVHSMTPPQIVELFQKATQYVSDIYAASWSMKAVDPRPLDYRDNALWP